ncbi:thioesterase II family protein [Nocardia suismassiliense]|uniref:Thioesterase TesA n=1 Tax=Nocardia suismassiliense TaxID=2077092 RepID=A0ABW6QMF6_9NOCA
MTQSTEQWLECDVVRLEAPQRLICFPHAGGSASFFRQWGRQLNDIEVCAVRYPGRAQRMAEPSPTDLQHLGADIAEALVSLSDRPMALFGHSMGAVVALETARHLEEQGISVAHLFASGSRNAPLPDSAADQAEEDPDMLSQRLIDLGGTNAELVADPFFQELVLPYILGDARMFHSYSNRALPLLRCPVTTIFGDADADSDRRPWPELTEGTFCEQLVSGDHFYLTPNPPFDLIRTSLDTTMIR